MLLYFFPFLTRCHLHRLPSQLVYTGWQTRSTTPIKTLFQSAGGGVCFHLLSHQWCAAVSKTGRKGMNSQRNLEWGEQEIIQQPLQQEQHQKGWQQWAWERWRKENVCEREDACGRASSNALWRTELSCAVAWRAVCSRLLTARSGEAELTGGEMPLPSDHQHQWKPAPDRGITMHHGRSRDPLLTPAWLIMTAHAWVTRRPSRAAVEGNRAMWKWLGCQQLLDMFSRANSGFFSVFELVFLLLVLSGCPKLTCQARNKGRWNKGGK